MPREPSSPPDGSDAIRERFEDDLGWWHPSFDELLELDPAFLDRYRAFLAHPWREGPLDERTKALVCLAVHASPTHMDADATRRYADLAFEHGASLEAVLEVLELVSTLGIHAITVGVPILVDEAGLPEYDEAGEAELEAARQAFRDRRQYWDEGKEPRLRIDPEHFRRYLELSAHPWETGVLEPKVREFVYIAIDAAVTHVFAFGTRLHVQNALDQGASREEVLEVLQLAAGAGLDALQAGLPIVTEVARDHGQL